MSDRMEWCDKHNHQFHEDDGCEYCYEIYKIYSEIVNDLEEMAMRITSDDVLHLLGKLVGKYQKRLSE